MFFEFRAGSRIEQPYPAREHEPLIRIILLIAFIVVPLLEIAILINLGGRIGFWWTLGIVIGTAIVGTSIMHRQGLSAMLKAQSTLEAGKIPVEPVVDGMFLLLAGAFLLTPGLLTDAVGFLFLFPPFRRFAASRILKRFIIAGTASTSSRRDEFDLDEDIRDHAGGRTAGDHRPVDGDIIEGEFERINERPLDPDKRK